MATLLAVYANRAHRRARFEARIEAMGGNVYYAKDDAFFRMRTAEPSLLHRLLGDDIEAAYIAVTNDDQLAVFDDCPEIQRIDVAGRVSDKGVARLSRLRNLKSLSLKSNLISIRGLEALAAINGLRQLHVMDNGFTDQAAVERLLASMPQCQVVFGVFEDLTAEQMADDDETDASP
ncbi:MAG TPA: hypothetical protein VG826_08130 [Pirellulales bacterium]|nr:hypothetical protein [Pirellulales bacterium]